MRNKKLDPTVFVKAARRIQKHQFACNALAFHCRENIFEAGKSRPYIDLLEDIYKPRNINPDEIAWFTEGDDDATTTECFTGLLRRELALLFLAEMVKTENKEKTK
jgi:hypothetical protein